jgi:hypothetical protein
MLNAGSKNSLPTPRHYIKSLDTKYLLLPQHLPAYHNLLNLARALPYGT